MCSSQPQFGSRESNSHFQIQSSGVLPIERNPIVVDLKRFELLPLGVKTRCAAVTPQTQNWACSRAFELVNMRGRAENRTQMDTRSRGLQPRQEPRLSARPETSETSKSPPRFLPRAGSHFVAAISAYLRIGIPSSNHLLGFGFITDDRPHLSHTRRSALEGALHSCRRQHEGTSNRIVATKRFVKDCDLYDSQELVDDRVVAKTFRGHWNDRRSAIDQRSISDRSVSISISGPNSARINRELTDKPYCFTPTSALCEGELTRFLSRVNRGFE